MDRNKLLYVIMRKALCSYIIYTILFYYKISGYLEANWFKINPYEQFAGKTMFNTKKFTIIGNAYDLKLSCANKNEVINDQGVRGLVQKNAIIKKNMNT